MPPDDISSLLLLFQAICIVESGDNPLALNSSEYAIGPSQIRPACLIDVNAIRHAHKPPLPYIPLGACTSREVSLQVFLTYTSHYLPRGKSPGLSTLEIRARIWNGGPRGYLKPATRPYWEKVRAQLLLLTIAATPTEAPVSPMPQPKGADPIKETKP